MSSENPGSGWSPTLTPTSYVDDEWVNSSDIGPGYEGFAGNFAGPEYSIYSSYPGNFFPTTTGAPVTQATSMVSPTYTPNDVQYSNSSFHYQEASNSSSSHNQNL
jgi:hypothetical protein